MTFPQLPRQVTDLETSRWGSFQPFFDELIARELTTENARAWLKDWSDISRILWEAYTQSYIDKSLDTTDEVRERRFLAIVEDVLPEARRAEQKLKERFLQMEWADDDLQLVVRDLRNQADLFREENVPILTELEQLSNEYEKLTGSLTAEWEGETKNLSQLQVLLREKERPVREKAWRTLMGLWQSIRPQLDDLFLRMVALRRQMAANADLTDYRAYVFREYGRFDYTPEDCFTFHDAIEQIVVPVAQRVLARKQALLGVAPLRPWDVDVEPGEAPPLKPYQGQAELIDRSVAIFEQVDDELARYVTTMAENGLLDLDTRAGKALGGYCSHLTWQNLPYIFMNGTGIHEDVQTLLHEAGHAFHVFESSALPFTWQTNVPMEFAEVASMAMELLAAPYLTRNCGGFYSEADAARARIEHLEGIVTFLPYMAVVDAFQHWVYTQPDEIADAAALDATWDRLWQRFMPGVAWSDFHAERISGWHRKPHIFEDPFYYIEYGMAQVGALQVWRNSIDDHAAALAAYRRALALGGTVPLPSLFEAAGAQFRFDPVLLADLVDLVEQTIGELAAQA